MDSAETAYLTYAKLRLQEPEANDAIGRAYLIRNDNSPDFKISRMVAQALYGAHCGEIQKAAEFFQKSLREAADSSYQAQIYFQMGRVYEDAGEYPLALGAYEELVKKYSGHQLAPLAELRMGIILLESMGDKERARKHLERVVLEYPAGVATPEARRLLRSLEKNSS
jgi:TolA-binding protein